MILNILYAITMSWKRVNEVSNFCDESQLRNAYNQHVNVGSKYLP